MQQNTHQKKSRPFSFECLAVASILLSSAFLMPAQSYQWARGAGGTNSENGQSIAADASGNVYVSGSFLSTSIVVGSYTLNNVSGVGTDIFLAKYDNNGNVLWAKSAGDTEDEKVSRIALDASGNVYVTGAFTS